MKGTDDFLGWMESHRDSVGLVANQIGAPESGIDHNGAEHFPLASTRKILILGAFAMKVGDGSLDPMQSVSLTDLERWYWPGTDGGAHEMALKEWNQQGKLEGSGNLKLDDVVHAMIRWSDNAAADYLLERVGGPAAVDAFAEKAGMQSQEPLMPVLGEFAAWSTEDVNEWKKVDADERSRRAEDIARKTTPSTLDDLNLPSAEDQFDFSRTSPAGTPRDWARLMSYLHQGSGFAAEANDVIRRHLEWPLEAFPNHRDKFDRFGTKGGALPGVVTEAMYIEPKAQDPWVVALFLGEVPERDWRSLLESFIHQRFILEFVADGKLRQEAQRVLSG